jgi:hypothetical protein
MSPNEEVFVVARQSGLKPGGSRFTPNIIFATDRRTRAQVHITTI